MEIWKPIPGFPAHEASCCGRVRKGTFVLKQHVSHSRNGKDYKRITLSWDGKRKNEFAHTLICLAFRGNKPFLGAVVMHKDDDGFNNRWLNLQWGTQSFNLKWINMKQNEYYGQQRIPELDEVGDAWEPD